MRRFTVLLLILAIFVSAEIDVKAKLLPNIETITYYNQIPDITKEEIDAIERLKKERGSLTYGYLLESDSFIAQDGTLAGFTVYLSDFLTNLFGIPFTLKYCDDWPDLKEGIDNGTIDFSGVFTPTEERLESYYMSIPVAGRTLAIYMLKSNTTIETETDVNGIKLGFMSGTINANVVRERYPELDFETVAVSSFDEAVAFLQSGKIDAFVGDSTSDIRLGSYDFLLSKDFFSLVYSPVSITTSQKELEPVIDVIDKYLEAGGIDTFFALYKKGEYVYTQYKLYQSFTEEEISYLADMAKRGAKVDIGLQHDAYPVSFYNSNADEYQGVAIDILSEITMLTGLEFAPITTSNDTPIAVILEKLKVGEISMMTQLLYAESRKNDYIWNAIPYLQTRYAMLSKTEMPDLAVYQVLFKKVGTVYKTAHEEMFEKWFPDHENRVIYSTTDEAFNALARGEIELLMLSENMLLTLTNYREMPGYKINISFDRTLDSFFGFHKNETVLRSVVDKTMEHIDLEKIGSQWMNRVFDYSKKISDMRGFYLLIFTSIVVLILIVVLFMFIANQRLSRSLTRHTTTLSAIYSSIPDTVFCKDTEGAYTSCNPSFEKQLGMRESEIVGKTYSEIRGSVIEDAGTAYLEVDAKVLREGTRETVVETITYPDGSKRILETLKAPLMQNKKIVGLLGIGRDITERETQNKRLRKARESLQAVLDSLPMPIRIIDLGTGEIVYANNSLAELLEYDSPLQIEGYSITEFLPETLSDGTPSGIREKMIKNADEPYSVEIEYVAQSGKLIDALVVARRIDYHGRPASIGIIKDLAAEKERAQVLLDAAEREKEASRAKSMFLANMSHEIRTPMNGILGMTDLLMGEDLEERQLQYVKDIKNSAESLLGIINDILDLSKIGEGRLQINPVDMDLSMLLRNIVSMMQFTARSKGLQFIEDIRIGAPEYVRMDDVRLNQIILNIISNAIKFTNQGYVRFSAEIVDGQINFVVSDSGIGIKKEDLPLIFTAFEQVDKKKNRSIKGTGLGLSITQSLVDLMGGNIRVESEYGAGTTFYVALPYVAGNENAVQISESDFQYVFAPSAHVLLVDDIQTNLTVGAGLLRLCGITADVAMTGMEAIDLIKENSYDIVFMDHMMPEMDGIEAMEYIREMGDSYKDLPIIALTANAVNESKDFLLASGMSDFISKPIDKGALMNILQKWLPAEKLEYNGEFNQSEEYASYSQILEEASHIDGLDIRLALTRIGGIQPVLEASIKQVAYSAENVLKKMDTCLSAGDLRGFAIEAHGLKGGLANIGAARHSELAAELEIASKAENKQLCMNKFVVFCDIIRDFAEKLQTIFPQAERKNCPEGDEDYLRKKVSDALNALDNFEAEDALKVLTALESFTFGIEIDALLNQAKLAAESFDYENSTELLSKIRLS